jgi:hypothetical protein
VIKGRGKSREKRFSSGFYHIAHKNHINNKKKEEEMLKKFLFISLACIGVMAILVPQVDAGCCCKPRMCCPCISGSLICEAKYLQVWGSELCDELGNCPEVTVNVYGIPEGEALTLDAAGKPDLLDYLPVPGVACCANPGVGSVKNPKKTPEEVTEGRPFRWPSSVGASGTANCDHKNNCRATVIVDPSDENFCVNPNWEPLGWTPGCAFDDCQDQYTYRKQSFMCPGAYDSKGDCCATAERVGGVCKYPGEEREMIEDCTMDLREWNCSDEIQEDCTVIWDSYSGS